MNFKKLRCVQISFIFLILLLPLAFAEVEVEKESITKTVIPEINKSSLFRFEIKNTGETDNFEIYSLAGANFEPSGPFEIKSGENKILTISVLPEETALKNLGTFNFVYKIKGEKTEIFEDVLTVKIMNLKNAIEIGTYDINLEDESARIFVENHGDVKFSRIETRFYSDFFDFNKTFSLGEYEKKEFETEINREKTKELTAGQYTITADVNTYGAKKTIKNSFNFAEKTDIKTDRSDQGFFITKTRVEKTNQGNLPVIVQTKIKKNIISRLFTNFNVDPAIINREGFSVTYTFQEEIEPSEVYVVRSSTNWFYPFIILVALVIIVILFKAYTFTDLLIKKKATYVKTKGGEFALKITLRIKAKNYLENIEVVDKIPSIVKVYKRFGAIEPDKIDNKNRRLEWNVDSLQSGEERVFSYIIYSKLSPVGKFELPVTTAVYEKEGDIHEAKSNKVFFLTEPKKKTKKEK